MDKKTKAQLEKFVKHMLNYTVRLIGREENGRIPQGAGVFYQRGERVFLLSVGHGLCSGEWFVETDYVDEDCGVLLLHLRDPITFHSLDDEMPIDS